MERVRSIAMMELLQFDKLKNAAVLRVENFLLIKLPRISGKRAAWGSFRTDA
jgi:hypothetical protein